jgi:hypothetical protein
MSILEESDFVITQKGGNYKAMNLSINNILKSNDQPAIIGGGTNIFSKNKLGIPFGLAMMNNFIPKNSHDGGNKKTNHNKEMRLIKDELYDELLSLCQRTERVKKGIKLKTRSKKSKKPKRKKTRKK